MSAPIITPTVPGESQLANKWVFQVDTTPESTATWTTVFGMSAFTPNLEYTEQDNTDFDSDGWKSTKQTQRGWSVSGTLQRKRYAGLEDAGQGFLRRAAFTADDVHVRWFDRYHGTEANEGYASPKWEPQGGGATDLESVNFTLGGQGKILEIANPYNVVPVLVTALPSGVAVGGTVTITGTQMWGLTGAAAVKFGGTNATSYIVDSETQVRAVMPAGSAGSAAIIVTNPAGASNSLAYTRGA